MQCNRNHYFTSNDHSNFKCYCRLLADNLLSLCTYVIKDRPGISDWLFAIPLLHFLSGTAKPYLADILFSNVTPPEMKDLEDSWWGSQGLNLIGVRQRAERSRYGLSFYQ